MHNRRPGLVGRPVRGADDIRGAIVDLLLERAVEEHAEVCLAAPTDEQPGVTRTGRRHR